MPINPMTGLEEDNLDPLTGMPRAQSFSPDMLMTNPMPDAMNVASLSKPRPDLGAVAGPADQAPDMAMPAADPKPISPNIREYLLKRKAEREALSKDTETGLGTKGLAALAALGAGFQGKDSAAAGNGVLDRAAKERDSKLKGFDATTDLNIRDKDLDRQYDMQGREDDVNSDESKLAHSLAERMGYKGPALTATKFKSYSPALSKMYDIEQKKLDRQDAREERRFLSGERRADKKDARDEKRTEKETTLKTPYGLANTDDDAKKIKEGHESKKNFDKKLNEMISLRTKHGGGALMNREDVGRGKQLSKDLLLEYKNMAKLGVLSAADEAIIDQIIPADPLEYNSPAAAIQGQDPILHKLKKFKEDSDADFKTRIATRTRGGVDGAAKGGDRKVVKTQTNQKTGEKRIVYDDGTTEVTSNPVAGR